MADTNAYAQYHYRSAIRGAIAPFEANGEINVDDGGESPPEASESRTGGTAPNFRNPFHQETPAPPLSLEPADLEYETTSGRVVTARYLDEEIPPPSGSFARATSRYAEQAKAQMVVEHHRKQLKWIFAALIAALILVVAAVGVTLVLR